jgi:hypothetical protein
MGLSDSDLSRFAFTDLGAALAGVTTVRPWLVEGLIEGTPIVTWIAGEKSMKSWVAMYLSACIATGTPAFGRHEVRRPGPVIYVDAEYGPHEFARRLARIARGIGRTPSEVASLVRHFYSYEFALEGQNEAAIWLLRAAKQLRPSLIVLDPWRNVLDGEENSTDAVKRAMAIAAQLRDQASAAILVPHHLNRAGTFNGSRALLGRADLIVEGTDEAEPLYRARGRTVRRKDPLARPFSVAVEHVDDEDDVVAKTLFSIRFEGDVSATSALSKPALKILAALRESMTPMGSNDLMRATGITNGRERAKAIGDVKAAGLIVAEGTKWKLAASEFFDSIEAPEGGSKPG